MKVKDAMTPDVVVANESATLEHLAELMLTNRVGSVVIVDEDRRPVGIVTQTDYLFKERGIPFSAYSLPSLFGSFLSEQELEAMYERGRRMRAAEVMSRPVKTINEQSDLWQAAAMMHRHDINRLPVLRDEQLVGIIARHDLLKSIGDHAAER